MRHRLLASLLLLLFSQMPAYSQNLDISMQAWYWDYFQNGNFGNWINNLNGKASELQQAGFKHIWLPPLSRSSNADNFSNGYNPKDLYDFGEFGPACAWGTRAQLDALISNYNAHGLNVVSDMIYNHRDGGSLEKNEAVRYFITTQSNSVVYPSDRFVCALPLGSANPGGNGAGDYYLKIKSKSSGYNNNKYKFYAKTSLTTYQGLVNEMEPNGGLDCNDDPTQPSQAYTLGQDLICKLGPDMTNVSCHIDEIKITLTAGNFNATDDTLFVYLTNYQSGYSDHYIYGLWSAPRNQDIVSELEYHTYTDYTAMPSGAGEMDYNGFRPNDETSNAGGITETLGCDWNCPLFFYDYDQNQTVSQDVLNEWTEWQIADVGVKGLRMDAVKHFDPAYVGQMMDYLQGQNALPEFAVGEFFDYNAGTLKNWVEAVDAAMSQNEVKVRTFDFALRSALKNACDQFGNDVRNIFTSGMVDAPGVNADPFKVVTFVDNHDIRHEGNYIINDARLAYAYILTNNQVGAPCVFYPDYFGGSVGGAPNIMLKSRIDALIELHETYIYESEDVDYLSGINSGYCQFFVANGNNGSATTSLIYQLKPNSTGKAVIVAINFSGTPLDMYQCINTSADWGNAMPGTTFTDILGYSGGLYTDITPSNEIHVTLPARSYTVYVQGQNTPLPVELLDFQAIAEKNRVLLRWSSASERNFGRYEVQRSVGAETHFETIGTVSGKNTASTANYLHYDEQPVFNQPLYYRLRMVDADGKIDYSPVRTATLAQHRLEAFLAPNPGSAVSVYLNVQTAQDFRIRITDALGQLVYEQQYFAEVGESAWPLPTAKLPNGTYQVLLQGEREVLAMPLMKTN